jgi:predicted TIM-barrel fold metal-dependent hydrolase
MQMGDMTLVSIDDHVVEPPDLFARHMPTKYSDKAPRVERVSDGTDRWMFQGMELGISGMLAVITWPYDDWTSDPVMYTDMRPGCYRIEDRICDMNVNGVLTSMAFPTFPGFAGTLLAEAPDRTLSNMVVSAYNDWHLAEWAGSYPGRFIPLGILPIWDVDASVDEIRRLGRLGFTAVTFPDTPYASGLPSCYTDHWDPIFKELCDQDIAMCLHIGGAFNLLERPMEAPIDQRIILSAQFSAVAVVDLMVSGTFERFPTLKVATSEGGIGWIPLLLDRIDFNLSHQMWSDFDLGGKTGTEVFRQNFLGCFIRDPSALRLWDRIGIENIAWECDYPHSDSSWPLSPESLFAESNAAELTDAQIEQITWRNACRFFRYDPHAKSGFTHDQGTVDALRALAGDVDTTTTSRSEYRQRSVAGNRLAAQR